MYVLIKNGTVKTYPYSIRQLRNDNPNISFPRVMSNEKLSDFGVYFVVSTTQDYDEATQKCIPNGCVFNEALQRWETAWSVINKTQEELANDTNTKAIEVRFERNRLLKDSDWTQIDDAQVDKTTWSTYRQALRDVPSQEGFPWNVTWPEAPGA